ncbi:MAG: hypothetical protein RLZZ342_305 [Candidatus Parcubacteria bacterium]
MPTSNQRYTGAMTEATLETARALMGDTLAFHILFALLGVGLPFLMSVFEGLGLWYKDEDYRRTARTMGFAVTALFVTGAVSGTIVSFQINLLWPYFMQFANPIIGLPFVLEGFAFLVEAVFLGIYLYSWDKLSPFAHWLCSFPLWIGSFASAFLITTVNGWMNNPQGFTLAPDGTVSNIQPWVAMFNPTAFYEITHSLLAYYLTATFLVAAVFAWRLLRIKKTGGNEGYYQKMLTLLLSLALFFATAVGIAGDNSGKHIAQTQPIKFAAAESVYKTGGYQPLVWAGYVVPVRSETEDPDIRYELSFPNALSWLAFDNPSAVVQGLDAFPRSEWPPLYIHYFLNIMITIGIYLGLVPLVFFLLRHSPWRAYAFNRPLLWAIVAGAPLAFLAVEMGWMLTEIGRQPYIIKGIMRTSEAVTTNTDMLIFAWIFPFAYLVLFAFTWWILRYHYIVKART